MPAVLPHLLEAGTLRPELRTGGLRLLAHATQSLVVAGEPPELQRQPRERRHNSTLV